MDTLQTVILGIAMLLFGVIIRKFSDIFPDPFPTGKDPEWLRRIFQQTKTIEEVVRHNREVQERKKERSKRERTKIYNKVMEEETKKSFQETVQRKVVNALENACNANGFGVPDAYLEQLTKDICNAVYTGL